MKWRRDNKTLWEAGMAAGGVSIIGLTLYLYPSFDSSVPPTTRPALSTSAADRQIESAKSHLTDHPEDIGAYIALAMANYQKGPEYYVEAMNALEKARALGATSEHLFFYAGVMYDALGLPDYAINELSKYLRHHPNDYESTIRLANLHFRLKQYDQAQMLYKAALKLWPKDATAWYNFAVVNKEKKAYDDALSNLKQVEKIAGHLPEGGHYQKGEIYRLQGDTAKALEAYQEELAAHPEFIPALEGTEAILRAQGDQKQSRELKKRIAQLKKEQAQALKAQQALQAQRAAPAPVPAPAPAPAPAPVPAPVPVPVKPQTPAPEPSAAPESSSTTEPAASTPAAGTSAP